ESDRLAPDAHPSGLWRGRSQSSRGRCVRQLDPWSPPQRPHSNTNDRAKTRWPDKLSGQWKFRLRALLILAWLNYRPVEPQETRETLGQAVDGHDGARDEAARHALLQADVDVESVLPGEAAVAHA